MNSLDIAKNKFWRLPSRYFRKRWHSILIVSLLSIVGGIFTSLVPLAIAPVISLITNTHSEKTGITASITKLMKQLLGLFDLENHSGMLIFTSSIFVIVFSVGGSLIIYAAGWFSVRLNAQAYGEIAQDVFNKLQSLPLSYHQRQKPGELINLVMLDACEVINTIDWAFRQSVEGVTMVCCYGYILLSHNYLLAGVLILAGVMHALITRLGGDKMRQKARSYHNLSAAVSGTLEERIKGIRLTQSFGAEDFAANGFSEKLADYQNGLVKLWTFKHLQTPFRTAADTIAGVIVLIAGAWMWGRNQITGAELAIFLVVTRLAVIPISKLGTASMALNHAIGCSENVSNLLNIKSTINDGDDTCISFKQSLRFDNVSFSYDNGQKLFDSVNIHIQKGEILALVGPSGSGKSTLLDLILRHCEATNGAILLDNKCIRNFKKSAYRSIFGVVTQDNFLFHTSIRENILMGRQENESRLSEVIRIANAEDFINPLPKGLDTIVGDRGTLFSGGERQRIAIARALYDNPEIILLDEATSALDSESERLVQDALEKALLGRTAVVVAHRLSTIKKANKILVLKDGKIESSGTHEELKTCSPTYQFFCQLQHH